MMWTIMTLLFASELRLCMSAIGSTCCPYCRGDESLWTSIGGAWQLTLSNTSVDLGKVPAVLLDDRRTITHQISGESYNIEYGGAPINIKYESLLEADRLLGEQYVEYELSGPHTVSGVITQGGYVHDTLGEVMWPLKSWITHFLVSYATSPGTAFRYVTSGSAIVTFSGNEDVDNLVVSQFPDPITAQLIRVHPLRAKDHYGDVTKQAFVRVGVVTCSNEGYCTNPRFNCFLNPWQPWGECTCDHSGCTQKRIRTVGRYEACGGTPCGNTEEWQTCVPETPLWKLIAIGVGAGACGLLILLLVIILPIKKYQKSKQPEVVFKKDAAKQKTKKKRALRSDTSVPDPVMTEGAEDINDDLESELYPTVGDTGVSPASKGNKKKVTFDSQDEIRSIRDDATVSTNSDSDFSRPADVTPRDVSMSNKAGGPGRDPFGVSARGSSGLPAVRRGADLDSGESLARRRDSFDDEFTEYGF